MTMKEHKFLLVVKTSRTRKSAELAVLTAFGIRQPDGCEFYLLKSPAQNSSKLEKLARKLRGMIAGLDCSFDNAYNRGYSDAMTEAARMCREADKKGKGKK